jgi:ABC-type multidrug transport system ATPase subunit
MLEVNGLWKSFGGKPALEDVSFKVEKGEIFGLLGHNGAGKSTSLGIILGMVATATPPIVTSPRSAATIPRSTIISADGKTCAC